MNKKVEILVVDDELSMREFLSLFLEREGFSVTVASNADEAKRLIRQNEYAIVISDVNMPGLNGIELLEDIKKVAPETVVFMITAFSTTEQAVEAMKLGAFDYIPKPFKLDDVKRQIQKALQKRGIEFEVFDKKSINSSCNSFYGIVGVSNALKSLIKMIEKAAPATTAVLITGESGTGKELVARAIHNVSRRRTKPFVAVNCGAIPENLMEAELFGHKKGGFTGAISDRAGLFAEAEGGSIFLDEIGELPLNLQTKLLRVIQEKEFRPVGDSISRKCDVRIITATNRNLEETVKNGQFREDLFYRINVLNIHIPPLRERIEDIEPLTDHFFQHFGGKPEREGTFATAEALSILKSYNYPGNIRELENIIERALLLDNTIISAENLAIAKDLNKTVSLMEEGDIPEEGIPLEAMLEEIEKRYLLKAIEKTGGKKKKAAALLKMSFRSFRYRLSKFGIASEDEE